MSGRRGSRGSVLPSTAIQADTHTSNLLDLTAITSLRRKSVHAEIDLLNSSANAAGGMPHMNSMPSTSRTATQDGDTPALSRNNSSITTNGTPRRRGSRTGSISGLTAEQAVALSSNYGAGDSAPSSGRRRSIGGGGGAGAEEKLPSHTNSTNSIRRGSHDGPAFGILRANNDSSNSGRRISFERSSADDSTGSNSSQVSKDKGHRRSFEKNLVAAAQYVMQHIKGRSIQSIIKSPSYGAVSATTKRGITIITNNICLGGRDDAADLSACRKMGITHVLNLAQQLPNFQEDELICKKMSLEDREDFDILAHVQEASEFISSVENMGGRVLVHCISGVSRSVTMVLMHMITKHGIPLKDAYDYVLSCRPWIAPNDGFKLQLTQLEIQKFSSSSVSAKNSGKAWEFYAWNSRKAALKIMKQVDRDRVLGKSSGGSSGGCIGTMLCCFLGG
jgi:protein-tyrosine phosphatase